MSAPVFSKRVGKPHKGVAVELAPSVGHFAIHALRARNLREPHAERRRMRRILRELARLERGVILGAREGVALLSSAAGEMRSTSARQSARCASQSAKPL